MQRNEALQSWLNLLVCVVSKENAGLSREKTTELDIRHLLSQQPPSAWSSSAGSLLPFVTAKFVGLQSAESMSRIHVKEKKSQNNSQYVKTIKVREICFSQPQVTFLCCFSPHITSALKDQCFLAKAKILGCVALHTSPVWVVISAFVSAGTRAGCRASALVSCAGREAEDLLGHRWVRSQLGAPRVWRPWACHLCLIFRHGWSHSFKTHWIEVAHCYYHL